MRFYLSLLLLTLLMGNTIYAQSDYGVQAPCEQEVTDAQIENALILANGQRIAVDIDLDANSSLLIQKVTVNVWSLPNPAFSFKVHNARENDLPGTTLIGESNTSVISVQEVGTVGGSDNPIVFKKHELELSNPILIENKTNASKKYWLELVSSVNTMWQTTTKSVKGKACAVYNPNGSDWVIAQDTSGIIEAIYKIEGDCNNMSVNDLTIESKMKIFPNPANDFITLKGINLDKVDDLYIYNIKGQKVNVNLMSKQIDVSKLKSGVYFISFRYNNENYSSKFIKK